MVHTPSIWGVSTRHHAAVCTWARFMAHTPSVWGVSARRGAVTSSFIRDISSDSKILYHHVDLGEITATDPIERESCGALFAIFHLIFYVLSFYAFLFDSSTHTNSLWCLRLSSVVAPPLLGASTTAHLSILVCIGKVLVCCLYQEHKRLPVVQLFHTLSALSFIWELFFSLDLSSHYNTSLDPTGTPAQSPCALVQFRFSRFLPILCFYVWQQLILSQHLSKSK